MEESSEKDVSIQTQVRLIQKNNTIHCNLSDFDHACIHPFPYMPLNVHLIAITLSYEKEKWKSQIGINEALRVLKAPYVATEQIVSCTNCFCSLDGHSGFLLDHIFFRKNNTANCDD